MKNISKRITNAVIFIVMLVCLLKVLSIVPMRLTINQIAQVSRHATSITIIQGSNCEDDTIRGKVLAEITEKIEVQSFFSSLRLQPSLTQLFCMQCACGGDLEIKVNRQDTEPFLFTIHHGESIRLPKTISGDATITAGSAFRLAIWLSRHGVYDKGNVQPTNPPYSSPAAGSKR